MIGQTDIERYLDDWLGNTPMAPADRVVVGVAVRIRRERQRPAPWASRGVSEIRPIEWLSAAAALLVVVVAGAVALRQLDPMGTLPTPVPTPAPTPTPATTPSLQPSPSVLPSFAPGMDASLVGGVPEGWVVGTNGMLAFRTEDNAASVELLANWSVMSADCALGPQVGVPKTAEAMILALANRDGLLASNVGPADVGGTSGWQVDVRMAPATELACDGDVGYVPLIGVDQDGFWNFVGVSPTERIRLIALDVPGKRNLWILIVTEDVTAFDRHIADAMAIVERLKFDFGP